MNKFLKPRNLSIIFEAVRSKKASVGAWTHYRVKNNCSKPADGHQYKLAVSGMDLTK